MKTTFMFKTMIVIASCVASFTSMSCSDDDDDDLAVSMYKVDVAPAATAQLTVSNGTQPYTATLADATVATATVSKNAITVTGVKEGKTTLLIADNNKKSASVIVEVKNGAQPTLSFDLQKTLTRYEPTLR